MEHKNKSCSELSYQQLSIACSIRALIELTNLALTLAHADHGQSVVALVAVANAEEKGDPATGAENG